MMKKTFLARCFGIGTVLGLCCSLFLMAGCSGGTKSANISGKVTYKGQPVTGGTINLVPADGKVESAFVITIKPDGSFAASDVPPGAKKVFIETESVKLIPSGGYNQPGGGGKVPDEHKGKQFEVDTSNLPKYVQIPKKYGDINTSGLTWDIAKGKQEPKTFELVD